MFRHILISLVFFIVGLIAYDHLKGRKQEGRKQPEGNSGDAAQKPIKRYSGNGGDGYESNTDETSSDLLYGSSQTKHYNTL